MVMVALAARHHLHFGIFDTSSLDVLDWLGSYEMRLGLREAEFGRPDTTHETMKRISHGTAIFLLLALSSFVVIDAYYVSYETPRGYKRNESIPIQVNKVTSAATLSAMDYTALSLCHEQVRTPVSAPEPSLWQRMIQAWHGDAVRDMHAIPDIQVLQDVYCGVMVGCVDDLEQHTDVVIAWNDAIQKQFGYNVWLDGLPSVVRQEDDAQVMTSKSRGVPLGRQGGGSFLYKEFHTTNGRNRSHELLYLYNHWNIEIQYKLVGDFYYILSIQIAPLSLQQYNRTNNAALVQSCRQNPSEPPIHTTYDMTEEVPLQPLSGKVYFTYDVIWVQDVTGDHSQRWNTFLSDDTYLEETALVVGAILALFILVSLLGVVGTWVLRDFSYKPVVDQDLVDDCTEEQANEMKMWPLSTRIFFPPTHAPAVLCILCGTGAQLLATSCCCIIVFRFGIINQSQGAGILTPVSIIYTICSVVGGHVTARLYSIFHGTLTVALALSLVTAVAYPLVGLVALYLTYDVLPDSNAPSYHALSSSTPLILVWMLVIWPLTVISGYFGHRAGPIHSFPISEGSAGYQDLDLQQASETNAAAHKAGACNVCLNKFRIPILLSTGGLLPVLACFVSYSYGFAGPVLQGYYSVRPCSILVYMASVLTSGAVAVLLHYRRIRSNAYEWWWPSFAVSASSGLYIFMLSISYMIFRSDSSVSGSTMILYMLWFAFTSLGIAVMTGFVGVAMCGWFTRAMYVYIMKQE